MKEYIVIKDILNIRNKPSDESDDTFVGQLLNGERVWLDEEEYYGVIPKGGETNIWKKRTGTEEVVAKDGVVKASEFWIKEYGIDELWKFTKGEDVTIILIDSGVNDFEDLASDRIIKASIFNDGDIQDSIGHGTLMASIICGKGVFISGVAPLANIISIKITNKEKFDDENFISALKLLPSFLENKKFSIINCSLNLRYDLNEETKNQVQLIINNLYSKYNILFVAAVGNDGKKENNKSVPASLNEVLSCAALRKSGEKYIRLSDSNYWPDINITAPGEFPSAQINNNLSTQGSSQSTAFVTGLLSLFVSKALKGDKILSFKEISEIVENCSDKIEKEISYNILNKEKIQKTFKNI